MRAPPRSCAKRPVGAATVTRARGDPQGFRPRALRPREAENRVTGPLLAGRRLRTVAAAGEEHGERRSARSSRSRRVLPPPRRDTSRTGRRRVSVAARGECQSGLRVETTVGRSIRSRRSQKTASRGTGSRRRSAQSEETASRGAARDGLRDVGTGRGGSAVAASGGARRRGGVRRARITGSEIASGSPGGRAASKSGVRIELPLSGHTARAARCRRRGWPRRPGGPARPRARRRSR